MVNKTKLHFWMDLSKNFL